MEFGRLFFRFIVLVEFVAVLVAAGAVGKTAGALVEHAHVGDGVLVGLGDGIICGRSPAPPPCYAPQGTAGPSAAPHRLAAPAPPPRGPPGGDAFIAAQGSPNPPQFTVSLAVSTHVPPQQTLPAGQTTPHAPQFLTSVVSTQTPAQQAAFMPAQSFACRQ